MSDSNIPRSIQIDKMVPAELAIREAIHVVEEAGADTLLTEAVILLGRAQEKVAEFVDRAPSSSAIARSARITELRNKRNREHDCRFEVPMIAGTSGGLGDFTRITCICGNESSTTGKEEAMA